MEREPRPLQRAWEHVKLHPGRSRDVIHLAYPVALGMVSITLLSVVDTAMLGWLGPVPLAAAGIASVAFFAIVFSLGGIGVGVQTLTARRYGEGNLEQSGEVLNAGLLLALTGGLPLVVASPWLSRLIAPFLSPNSEVVRLGEIYLRYRFFGGAFFFLELVFGGFFNGVGDTKQQLVFAILVTAVNILLDYLLIFGHAGLPRMGVAGAAIASTIATALGVVYLVAVSLSRRYRTRFSPYRHLARALPKVLAILRLSVPAMAQRFISNGSFFLFFAIVARIGTLELAASNVIRSVLELSIMPAIGIGIAAATLVGQNLGAKRPDEAEVFAWEAAKLAAYLMAAVGLLFVAFPKGIFSLYTNDPVVIALGRLPLVLLGATQVLGGVGIVIGQSLQGAGNTRFIMLVELAICGLLYLPTAYLLGVQCRLGIVGAWSGEFAYWSALALLTGWKFHQGRWKEIRI